MNDYDSIEAAESLEISELLEMLYNTVVDGWSVPLSKDKCAIPRESTLNLLEDIRAQLPVEIAEAKRLLSAKEEFIGNAKREADSIRRAAEEDARRLVEEQEIMQQARARANEIISSAEGKAREVVRVANEYVDDALRRTEEAISAAQAEVKNSRARFRGLAGSASAPSATVSEIQTISDEDMEGESE